MAGVYSALHRRASGKNLANSLPAALGDYALFHGCVALLCTGWAVVRLRALAIKQSYGTAQKVRRRWRGWSRPAIGNRPMLWKELVIESGVRLNVLGRIIVLVLVAVTFVFPFFIFDEVLRSYSWDTLYQSMNIWVRVLGSIVACLLLLAVAARASSSISNERDRQTWDALLTTPLESNTILFAKWIGNVFSVRWGWVWLGAIYALALVTGGLHPVALLLLLGAWFVYAFVVSGIGLWFSMVSRTTLRATLWTLLCTVGAGVGHWLLWMCCIPLVDHGSPRPDEIVGVAARSSRLDFTPPVCVGLLLLVLLARSCGASSGGESNGAQEAVLYGLPASFCWIVLGATLAAMNSNRFRVLTWRAPLKQRPSSDAPPRCFPPRRSDQPKSLPHMDRPHLLFVTGKLAEPALRRMLAELAPQAGFDYSVAVLPITVVALATTPWLAHHLSVPPGVQRVVLPGLCAGDLAIVAQRAGVPVERGPKDLRDLPEFFGRAVAGLPATAAHDIAILAEINHAPRLTREAILAQARSYQASGADVIDLGCDPGATWTGVGDTVRALRDEGLRVSIDSFNPQEVEAAVANGAELVLSVNSSNRSAARAWGCEVVVLPDEPATLERSRRHRRGADRLGRALPHRSGDRADRLRLRRLAGPVPRSSPPLSAGRDADGRRQPDRADRRRLGRRQRAAARLLPGARHPQRADDGGHQLVPQRRPRAGPGPAAGLSRLQGARAAQAPGAGPGPAARSEAARARRRQTLHELARRVTDRNFRLFAERGLLHVINGNMYLQGTDPFDAVRADERSAKRSIRPTPSTWATRWPRR